MASELRKSTIVALTKIVRSALPSSVRSPASTSTKVAESIIDNIENDPFLHGNIKLLRQNGRIIPDVSSDFSAPTEQRDGWFVTWDGSRHDIFDGIDINVETGVLDPGDDFGDPENPDLDDDYYETKEDAYRALVVAINRYMMEQLDSLVYDVDKIAKDNQIPYHLTHVNVLLQQDPKVW